MSNIIKDLLAGKALQFQEAIKARLTEKAQAAYEMKKFQVAQKMFKEDVDVVEEETLDEEALGLIEDYEQLDELSKGKLAAYVSKAAQDMHQKGYHQGVAASRQDQDKSSKNFLGAIKRDKGISKAVKRLTKEGVDIIEAFEQLDELSKETLGRYIKKAAHGADKASNNAAVHTADAVRTNSPKRADQSFGIADYWRNKATKRHAGIGNAVNKLTK